MDFKDIPIVILAGGLGTRLRAVVKDKPKPLASIGNKPFIFYIFEQLIRANAKKIILCTGYKADYVRETIGAQYKSLEINYSHEKQPLGTGGAVKQVLQQLNQDTIMVINGDSYLHADLTEFLNWFQAHQLQAGILLTRVSDSSRFGHVKINQENLITSFSEKGRYKGPGLINAGIYLFKKEILQKIPQTIPASLEYDLFPQLRGHVLYGYPVDARFIDIGTPDSFKEAESFFS